MSVAPLWWQTTGSQPVAFERDLVPAIFAAWADDLLDLAAVGTGMRVLDVACGTGVVTRAATQRSGPSGRVVGLDISPAMLTVAQSIPVPTGHIDWREADALAMPFPDHSFDAVVCAQGVQYFSDRLAGLREMRRVLVPDGRVALCIWRSIEHSPGFAVLNGVLAAHVRPGLVDAPFTLPDAEQVQQLLTDAGFVEITIRSEAKQVHFATPEAFVEQYVSGSPLAVALAQVDEGTMQAIIRDVDEQLQPYVTGEGLLFPIEAHLVAARCP